MNWKQALAARFRERLLATDGGVQARPSQHSLPWWSSLLLGTSLVATAAAAQSAVGSVLGEVKIDSDSTALQDVLDSGSTFCGALADIGDLDGNGVSDLAIGAERDNDGGVWHGAVWLALMNTDGTIGELRKISATSGGLGDVLGDFEHFGASVAAIGDVDGDGYGDLAVGSTFADTVVDHSGAVWILFLDVRGAVKSSRKLGEGLAGFAGSIWENEQFGSAVVGLGDLDGNGIPDLAVGAASDGDALTGAQSSLGTAWILFLDSDATVIAQQKIGDKAGPVLGLLDQHDHFGSSIARVGDLNGDGWDDLAVGATGDDDGGTDSGAVWLLGLGPTGATSLIGKLHGNTAGLAGTLQPSDWFGSALASLGDIDGDAAAELAVSAVGDDDGGENTGAVWILHLGADGSVLGHTKISATAGGLTDPLGENAYWGTSLAAVANLDGDDHHELVVGSPSDGDGGLGMGAFWRLSLAPDATVAASVKSSALTSPLLADTLDSSDEFGWSQCVLPDLDADGIDELVVGARSDHDAGGFRGAIWVLTLDSSGDVSTAHKLNALTGELAELLEDGDKFGCAVASPGDIDGDEVSDLAVGAAGDDDGGTDRGAVWILLLNADATLKDVRKLSALEGGFPGLLDDDDAFGSALTAPGDLDGDGVADLIVGAPGDDDGGTNRGALWLVTLLPEGGVKAAHKLSSTAGGFPATLKDGDAFGASVAVISDEDPLLLAAGATGDDAFAPEGGAVWLMRMQAGFDIASAWRLGKSNPAFLDTIELYDRFGSAVAGLGDLDADGVADLAVGAVGTDLGAPSPNGSTGTVWVVLMGQSGGLKAFQRITAGLGGFLGPLDDDDEFGRSLAAICDFDGDGDRDLSVGSPFGTIDSGGIGASGTVWLLRLENGPWKVVGPGLAGGSGKPSLFVDGSLAAGTPVSLSLASGHVSSPTVLILGLSYLGVPFKGGVLVPYPDVLILLTSSALGQATLATIWPAGVPSGFAFFCQWWIPGAGGATGWAATNGLMGETP